MITIDYLADHPDMIQVCASWAYGMWGCQREGRSLETSLAGFAKLAQKGAIPLGLIALCGDKPAGHIVLCEHDCDERPDLSPWMASVYVHPFYRGQGLALRLIARAEDEARRLGVETLYLVTGNAQGLYEKCGWQVFDNVTSKTGEVSCVMRKGLV